MSPPATTDRRSILELLAASTAAPLILPSRMFGAEAPSNKVTLGCIGVGWIRDIQNLYKKGELEIALYRSPGHFREFIDSIKSRKRTTTPVEIAHRSQTPGHLGHIASVTGRKIKWDAVKQEIIGDGEATRMMAPSSRGEWHI